MKTEKSKSKRKKQQSSSASSSSAAESNSSSNNSSSDESVEKVSKKYKQKTKKMSSNSSENSEDECGTSTKKIKHNKVHKKSKSSKRDQSSGSDSMSSFCSDADKKSKKANKNLKTQHIDKEDAYDKPDKEKTNENDTRIKRSRRELESSKWDSPVDKISYRTSVKNIKYNERSVSPVRKQRVEHESIDKDKYSHDGSNSRNGERNDNFNLKRSKDERKHQERRILDRHYDKKGDRFREYNDNKRHDYEKYGKERHSGNEDRGKNRSQDDDRRRHVEDRRYRGGYSMKDDRRSKSYERRSSREDRLTADDRKRNNRRERSSSQDRCRNRNDRRNTEYKRTRFSKRESPTADYEWGKPGQAGNKSQDSKKPQEKEKPNFSLSGKLTEEVNTYKGIVIKYSEPPEAYKPKRRWRLYPFKGEKAMQTLYIHRETAYLLGRERKIVDIPLDHPSCSKQHSVLQYRLVPFERTDGTVGKRVRPYIIDLGSANGTFLNNVKIESQKYIELFEKDVLKFGYSTREYVLLHENSKDEVQDDDVKEEEVKDNDKEVKPLIKKEKLEPMEPLLPQEVMIE